MEYPKPPINPVINLLVLVDSLISKYWNPQSISITLESAIHKLIGNFFFIKMIVAMIDDTITPVHRAHTGNWYPL